MASGPRQIPQRKAPPTRDLPLITFHPALIAVFALYFAALIIIAVVGARRMHRMSDYVLGGRRMGSITTALSASSSNTSGWTMLVLPALAFAEGAVHVWTIVSLVVGFWLTWTFMGKRLRRYTIELNALTIPEFLERRFDDRTGVLRGLAAALTIIFIMFYVNSGLIAGAKLLQTVFDTNHFTGVVITLIAVASYTFISGFLAVSRTDVFQSLIMLAGFIILPLWLIAVTDSPFAGLGETTAIVGDVTETGAGVVSLWHTMVTDPSADFGNLDRITGFLSPFTQADGALVSIPFLLVTLGWGLGAFGSQRVLQRFMAVESEDKITTSRNVGTIWVVAIFSFGFLFGLVARPALAEMGILDAVSDPELVYFVVAEEFFVPLVTGLLLTAVVAAVMSTADSQLLLGSAIATDDLPLVKRFALRLRRAYLLGADGQVWFGRLMLLLIGVVAAASAIVAPDSVASLVGFAWGGMGAAFGPALILALYWRRFNSWGALSSMVAGTLVALVWQIWDGGPLDLFDMAIAAAPGFIVATAVAVTVTLLTSKPDESVAGTFDRVTADEYRPSPEADAAAA